MSTKPLVQQRFNLNGMTMGTRYSAIFYAASDLDPSMLAAQLQQAVEAVDQQMSTWNPESDLMKLNRTACNEWLSVPEQLLRVLLGALHVSEDSDGAFEIGVGALVTACGFGPQPPSPALPDKPVSARAVLELDSVACRVRKHAPVSLDLNGIAKGFAVDQLARCLDSHGVAAYLVSIDGEMRAKGVKADGSDWCIALEKPIKGRREVLGSLALSNTAMATSGDYRHWRERDGSVFSHTMDPYLGAPLASDLASVSVLCASCMYADAWATALMVLGVERGTQVAIARGLSVIFVVREGDELREVMVGF